MFSSIELVEFSLDSVTKAEFVRSESPIIDGMEEDNDINYPTLKEHYPEKSELVDSMEEHFDIVKKDFQIIQRLIDAIDDSINSLEREVETYHDIVNGEYHAMWIGECFIRALKEQNARVGISEGGPVEKFVANALKQIFDIDVSHQAMVQRLKRHVKHRGKL